MTWKPIATIPAMTAVEIAEFPTDNHRPNITTVVTPEAVKDAFPRATHWRELTPETVAAALRKEGEPSDPPS